VFVFLFSYDIFKYEFQFQFTPPKIKCNPPPPFQSTGETDLRFVPVPDYVLPLEPTSADTRAKAPRDIVIITPSAETEYTIEITALQATSFDVLAQEPSEADDDRVAALDEADGISSGGASAGGGGGGLSAGAGAGIAIAVIAVFAAVAAGAFIVVRRRQAGGAAATGAGASATEMRATAQRV
jgi:hypothetical protein